MLTKYQLSSRGFRKSTADLRDCNLILLNNASKEELQLVCQAFDLNSLTFAYCSSPEEVSRYHSITSKVLQSAHILVIYDFIAELKKIENQLTPVILIFNQQSLIICTNNGETCERQLAEQDSQLIDFITGYILKCQQNLMTTLLGYKPAIDQLDAAAQSSFNNAELKALTNLTRKLVFFEHTMNDQAETINALIKDSRIRAAGQEEHCFNLEIQQRRLTKTIHIFRDLLDSISGLFTEMMNSRLNNLMKFLDSAGLVIAVAALVSGFMGMNVGGLPWKDTQLGFWLTLLISVGLATIIAIFLRKKSY